MDRSEAPFRSASQSNNHSLIASNGTLYQLPPADSSVPLVSASISNLGESLPWYAPLETAIPQEAEVPKQSRLVNDNTSNSPKTKPPASPDSPGWYAWREKQRQDREDLRASSSAWPNVKKSASTQGLRTRAATTANDTSPTLTLPGSARKASFDQQRLILTGGYPVRSESLKPAILDITRQKSFDQLKFAANGIYPARSESLRPAT